MNETTDFNELHLDIELADTLKRLYNNKDFQKIILDYFLDKNTITLTKNLTAVSDPKVIRNFNEQLKSRSHLYRFLMDIENNGLAAIEELKALGEEYDG